MIRLNVSIDVSMTSVALSLTRVEVQMQERGENVRGMAIDATRRLQQMEGDVSRIETLLDVVRDESTSIRASQSELKLLIQSNSQLPARGIENK